MYPGTFAARTPDKSAIVMADTGEHLTYAELEERSIRLARVLAGAGLSRGDHLAFVADNCPEVFVILWAGLRSGLYVTAVNHHLAPDEARFIVNDSGAQALIVSAAQDALARELLDETPCVVVRLAFGADLAGYGSYERALAESSKEPLADQPRGIDMLYSSGTTGRPKGIKPALPQRQVGDPGDPFLAVFAPRFGFDGDMIYYSPAPAYHAAPLRFGAMVHSVGGTVVMTKKFDAQQSLQTIDRHRVTHSQWVPTMFVRMLKLDPKTRAAYDISSLRVAIHAAAPCPVEVKQQMIDWWGPILYEYYSSTEGNGVTLIGPEEWLRHPGSVGQAVLGVIHICADDGAEMPTGGIGGVYFERDKTPFEYHKDPHKTREAKHPLRDNWTTTADVGFVDDDGYLYLTDRKAFTIISGGVNIYPQEVEDCLVLHPKVADVAVIGVPDQEMGEQVLAVVQPASGIAADAELERELLDFMRPRIARYKTPRSIEFTDQLPRSATGKLVKGVLKSRYSQGNSQANRPN
jgi:long-chain acyl-CoA synthetase